MLCLGNLCISPDHFIIEDIAHHIIFQIHRNVPNALTIFKKLVQDLIDDGQQSMNLVKDWSQVIPDTKTRNEIEALHNKMEARK